MLQSFKSDITVLPVIPGKMQVGIVPFDGMPDYARYYRWNKGKLGPLVGIGADNVQREWAWEGSPELMDGLHWYAGMAWDAFGHFITETITRSWWHLQNLDEKRIPIVLPMKTSSADGVNVTYKDPSGWEKQIWDYLGCKEVCHVDRPMKFEGAVVAEQGAVLFGPDHDPEYRRILSEYNRSVQGNRDENIKLFFMRPTGLSGQLIGESQMAELFESKGYQLVRPEKFSVVEQLEMARNASHVVAVQGSALHIYNLLGESPNTNVLTFTRLGKYTSDCFYQSFEPYVGKVFKVEPKVRFVVGGSSNNDITMLDVDSLFATVSEFDPSLTFSPEDRKFLQSIEEMNQMFLSGNPASIYVRQ